MPAIDQSSARRRPRIHRLMAAAAGLATVGALAAALPADAHENKGGGHLPSRYHLPPHFFPLARSGTASRGSTAPRAEASVPPGVVRLRSCRRPGRGSG